MKFSSFFTPFFLVLSLCLLTYFKGLSSATSPSKLNESRNSQEPSIIHLSDDRMVDLVKTFTMIHPHSSPYIGLLNWVYSQPSWWVNPSAAQAAYADLCYCLAHYLTNRMSLGEETSLKTIAALRFNNLQQLEAIMNTFITRKSELPVEGGESFANLCRVFMRMTINAHSEGKQVIAKVLRPYQN